jgi:dTDP-glucose 4,6-dehydratase
MPRDLVTGADGFIGSHLVQGLIAAGSSVRAFVQYNARNHWGWLEDLPAETLEEVDVRSGDLRDPASVRAAADQCDRIFHLGALIAIPYSYVAPGEYVATNVAGTLNVLQAAREQDVELLVHTSTSEVYGTARYVPIDEAHPLQAQSPYSASKIGADKLTESFSLSFRLPVVTVRPFNTYGPRQSARAVIPTIITQALSEPRVLLGSLEPIRDLTYVGDTVAGIIRAGQSPRAIGEIINLGQGAGTTIGELAEKIFELIGEQKEIVTDEQRVRPSGSEVMRLVSDNSKARELLGWAPKTGLEEGLTETISWLRARLDLYKTDLYNL